MHLRINSVPTLVNTGYLLGIMNMLPKKYADRKLIAPFSDAPVKNAVPQNYGPAEITRQAVFQHELSLKNQFSNINAISSAVLDLSKAESHVVALYLKDSNSKGLPATLKVRMEDGTVRSVATQVIRGGGDARVQLAQGDSLSDIDSPDYLGSICCAVESRENPDFKGIVTSGHIFTKGYYVDTKNGILEPEDQRNVLANNEVLGDWFYNQLHETQDLIVIRLNDGNLANAPGLKKFNDRYHTVVDEDVHTPVTILSRENKQVNAYILDHGIGYPVDYEDGTFYKKDIILLGNVPDREKSKPVSRPGDSGGCVFIRKGDVDKMVGILLGSDENFTFVLPIESTLSPMFKII